MHHYQWGEVAPLAPLAVPLTELVLFIVALGIIAMARSFIEALLGGLGSIVSHIPFIGGVTANAVHAAEQRVTNALGRAASALDTRIGAAWHELARMVDWVGAEIRRHANLLWLLSSLTLGTATTALLQAALAHLHRRVHAAVHVAEATIGRVHTLEKRLAHTIATDLYPRIRAAEHGLTTTLPREIANLRKWARAIEAEMARVFRLARRNEKALVGTAFAGAVAIALSRLGLGWLRCNSLRNIGNRYGCGGFRLLEDLLAGVIDVLVIADLCQLTKLLIEVAESAEVQTVITGIIDGMDELLRCQGVERPDSLDGYSTAPPPLQPFAALPAL